MCVVGAQALPQPRGAHDADGRVAHDEGGVRPRLQVVQAVPPAEHGQLLCVVSIYLCMCVCVCVPRMGEGVGCGVTWCVGGRVGVFHNWLFGGGGGSQNYRFGG